MTPQELIRRALTCVFPHEKMQVPKRQTRYTYTDGPMYYLGQQIVKQMEDAGYPAKIAECYRKPQRQAELKSKGRSKAGPWQSPHQYFEAVDIIHPSKGWEVSEDYWAALAMAVRTIEDKFNVELEHGHYWRFRDSAHVEIKTWREFKKKIDKAVLLEGQARRPSDGELADRFDQVIPGVR